MTSISSRNCLLGAMDSVKLCVMSLLKKTRTTFTKMVNGVISRSMAVRFMSLGPALNLRLKFVAKNLTINGFSAIIES